MAATFTKWLAARSPPGSILRFTALPQARIWALENDSGAVHSKLNVVVPLTPALGLECVIWELTTCVCALSGPPSASTPAVADTFNPACVCNMGLVTVRVYVCVDPGATLVGPERFTTGAVPPE